MAHASLVDVLSRELEAECQLPLAWYEVLLHLNWAPERRLRMRELAASVLLSKSGITRLVDRMEAAGLVERVSCPRDRRGSYAVLTEAGRRSFKKAGPIHLRGVSEHFAAHVSDAEARTLANLLWRIAEQGSQGPRETGQGC